MKLVLLLVLAAAGLARAEPDPEYQFCTQYGVDVHNFIDCLTMARDKYDRAISARIGVMGPDQRKAIGPLRKKQRADRIAKCGHPNPSTIAAAECQRALAKEQAAEFEKAVADATK